MDLFWAAMSDLITLPFTQLLPELLVSFYCLCGDFGLCEFRCGGYAGPWGVGNLLGIHYDLVQDWCPACETSESQSPAVIRNEPMKLFSKIDSVSEVWANIKALKNTTKGIIRNFPFVILERPLYFYLI